MMTFINNQRLAQLAGVNFDSEEIFPGPIVYSRTHTIMAQFSKLAKYPPCVLVTSFSDASVTSKMARRLPKNVRCWFSNNVATTISRVRAVPIGIRTSAEGEYHLRNAISKGRLPQKNLVYMNFYRNIPRPVNPREGIYEQFGGMDWFTTEAGFNHIPMDKFYEGIASHPYVISPYGAGPDCHRHWESILLGSIPIVIRSTATKILDELPCLQLNHWGELTKELLLSEQERLTKRFESDEMRKIWFEYWQYEIVNA